MIVPRGQYSAGGHKHLVKKLSPSAVFSLDLESSEVHSAFVPKGMCCLTIQWSVILQRGSDAARDVSGVATGAAALLGLQLPEIYDVMISNCAES
jgi:hypothetical protein